MISSLFIDDFLSEAFLIISLTLLFSYLFSNISKNISIEVTSSSETRFLIGLEIFGICRPGVF